MPEPDSITMLRIAPYIEAVERQELALRNLTRMCAAQMTVLTKIVSVLSAHGALPIEEMHKALTLVLAGLPEDDQKGPAGGVVQMFLSALREQPFASPARH